MAVNLHCYHLQPPIIVNHPVRDRLDQGRHVQQVSVILVAPSKAAAARLAANVKLSIVNPRELILDDGGFWARFLRAAPADSEAAFVTTLRHHRGDMVFRVDQDACVEVGTIGELGAAA